ncbi:MAG: SMP-30/gluconolactonase/LRE family protein [Bacteroidales bacterium]|nr:SMP-30/gluconolactonase/LRE family protein [Bacteroidales bacterium]
MPIQHGRGEFGGAVDLAEGWSLARFTPASRLYGANGLRTGPDGRIYVAQVSGSQISAIDVATGEVETISPMGGAIVAPDDLVFDNDGNLFATEITEGRVSMLSPDGRVRVVYGDLPCANPITFHQGRLFAGECRPGGRIMELDLDSGTPRVLVDNVPMPNAMAVGPDGMLYFPVMEANEIWRVSLQGGTPERVAGELGVPDAVKFDADGNIVTTQAASGQVLRINPRTGARTVLANLAPGLDNLTFVGDRLFVSSFSGEITEILHDGACRSLLPAGLNGPLGMAVGDGGELVVADGPYCYCLVPGESPRVAGMLFTPGSPGYTRGIAAAGPGEYVVTTSAGQVSRWWPAQQRSEVLAQGFDRLFGVAVTVDGVAAFVEAGAVDEGEGRLFSVSSGQVEQLASGLSEPKGVAITADRTCFVAEEGKGRVVRPAGNGLETVLDDLDKPQGLLLLDNRLYVVDVGAKALVEYDLERKARRTIATGLPVGAPAGVTPKFLRAFPPLSGSMGPFAGIAAGRDGVLYVSADGDGSIMALRPRSA